MRSGRRLNWILSVMLPFHPDLHSLKFTQGKTNRTCESLDELPGITHDVLVMRPGQGLEHKRLLKVTYNV